MEFKGGLGRGESDSLANGKQKSIPGIMGGMKKMESQEWEKKTKGVGHLL